MLPLGLRSAPKIFNAIANAVHWHLQQAGILHLKHYLDIYIIAPPRSPLCHHYLDILNQESRRLGVPIADHKRDGPTTCLTFLGIEIDTEAGQLRLPTDELMRLVAMLRVWENKRHCIRKDLESLIDLFNHACKVVRQVIFSCAG